MIANLMEIMRYCIHFITWPFCKHIYWKIYFILTLKEPGADTPSTFFVISQLIDIYSRWNFMTFFLNLALNLRPFKKKIRQGVMMGRCVIERWVQRKTDQKQIFNGFSMEIIHTNCVFCFQDTLSLCFIYLFGLFGVRTYV